MQKINIIIYSATVFENLTIEVSQSIMFRWLKCRLKLLIPSTPPIHHNFHRSLANDHRPFFFTSRVGCTAVELVYIVLTASGIRTLLIGNTHANYRTNCELKHKGNKMNNNNNVESNSL